MSKLTKGYKTGKATKVENCCREIRIQTPSELGKIYTGFNTLTDEEESWMLIKVNKNVYSNIVQRIYID